ncbi:Serine carboxypeptidase 24 [Zea mays]|uniref:Serine carboxypeptidase 24 n=1 Tax=Zea mays TaxID=4577 RepID=A0A1D6HN60_MAIZE|nr:Serine carboxypeptidase 24 [Zea mays]
MLVGGVWSVGGDRPVPDQTKRDRPVPQQVLMEQRGKPSVPRVARGSRLLLRQHHLGPQDVGRREDRSRRAAVPGQLDVTVPAVPAPRFLHRRRKLRGPLRPPVGKEDRRVQRGLASPLHQPQGNPCEYRIYACCCQTRAGRRPAGSSLILTPPKKKHRSGGQRGDRQLLRQHRHGHLLVDARHDLRPHLQGHPQVVQLQQQQHLAPLQPRHELRHEPRVRGHRPVQHLHAVVRRRGQGQRHRAQVQEHPRPPPPLLRLRPLHGDLRREVLQQDGRAEGDARQHHGDPLQMDCLQ